MKSKIKIDYIKKICDSKIFERASSYYRDNAISCVYRISKNDEIHGKCDGSCCKYYRVSILLNSSGDEIDHASCTCPTNMYYPCKHIAALLLQWHYKSDTFIDREPLDSLLTKQTKDKLVRSLMYAASRYPKILNYLYRKHAKKI